MTENQDNDNLERFFKANLENYSPAPSQDFWAKMEPTIPPCPAFWGGPKGTLLKKVGLLLLLTTLVAVALLWQRDRQQLKKLNNMVAEQRQEIAALENKESGGNQQEIEHTSTPKAVDKAAAPSVSNSTAAIATKQDDFAQVKGAPALKNPAQNSARLRSKTENQPSESTVQKVQDVSQVVDKQMVESKILDKGNPIDKASETTASLSENASVTPEAPIAPRLSEPTFIALKNTPVASKSIRMLATRHKLRRPSNPYPGFSVEVGATAFRMPLGRLFQQDTFLSGRTGMSFSTGIRVNYEINSTLTLQTGYQFTNLRARRLALRYNSFPFMVQKRWAWSRRGYVEGKTGVSLNSLVDTRTDSDGQSVKGLKTTWVGCHVGLAAAIPVADKLTLVVGPNAGFSLTPMTTGRRSWEMGVGASLRYQL